MIKICKNCSKEFSDIIRDGMRLSENTNKFCDECTEKLMETILNNTRDTKTIDQRIRRLERYYLQQNLRDVILK